MRYPNGKDYKPTVKKEKKTTKEKSISSANRGMNLERDINLSNEYYLEKNICLITKRPTPINIVKVDYTQGARITNAYFEHQSTTDYNGVYRGKYIDFEAKNTKCKTSFPLANISAHQIKHLKNVLNFGGIAFFIIEFETLNEIYLLDAKYVIEHYEKPDRKSIPYSVFLENAILIKEGFTPRLAYIDAVNKMYFND